MKFSKMYIPTTKEDPSDAVLPSHKYLIRGGFISQEGAGLYNFLPLGKIVLDKVRKIVKEELDNAGCQEVSLSIITPYELWQESGRSKKMGKEMLRFKDRKDNSFVISPTNEEAMVNIVRNKVKSYKDLPLNLYQINTKFRDEARPRFGLLRGREFLMKDGYSFHSTYEDMVREFNLMEEVYKRIFTRLGLNFRVVEADSGAIGGSGSKEFHVIANSGEDTLVVCKNCDYAANIEKATRKKRVVDSCELEKKEVFTPDLKTIDEVSEFLKVEKYQMLKAVAKKAIFEESEEIVIFFIRGDEELEETKAKNSVGAIDLVDVSEDELNKNGIVAGFIGPVNLGVKFIIDSELEGEKNLVCGANKKDYHLMGLDLNEIKANFADIIVVKEGDRCSKCGGELEYKKGIEVGHIFQLGEVYSKPLNATFLDKQGKAKPFIMGTYGIGVSRLVAAIIEQNHDSKGCIWTKATAPFAVDIIVSNAKKEEELKVGLEIYENLKKEGIEVIIDDRTEARFGFKMGDFELIGFSYGIIVGKKVKDGIVEIVDRKTLQKQEVKIEEVIEKIKGLI